MVGTFVRETNLAEDAGPVQLFPYMLHCTIDLIDYICTDNIQIQIQIQITLFFIKF